METKEEINEKTDQTPDDKGVGVPRLVRCWGCEGLFDSRALFTVDVEEYGEHTTKEVCEECMGEPDQPRIADILSANGRRNAGGPATAPEE